jgi:subtilase family serine protease
MILLLEPSAAQRRALDAELEAQQTPGSCEYHRWLTPQQFAETYANSTADGNAVADWLRSEGFTVAVLPDSRGWIEFSGTAAQVAQAFRSSVRAYSTAGGTRFALGSAISVPAALAPVIRGLVSLDGSIATAAITKPQSMASTPAALAATTDGNRAEALTPQLAAQLMHFDNLPQGASESIAFASRSNLQLADIAAFRSTFGLPASPVVVAPNGPDPGLTADQAAVELAVSWSGAAAPGASIVVAPARSTAATDGIDLSLAGIVDRSLANVVVVGYSSCEASLNDAHRAFYAALYRQAAAQGMSTIAATGDSGAAGCHAPGSDAVVNTGYAVNALASTPWNAAVGAAAFASTGNLALSAWAPANPADPAYATGGGRSKTYTLPAWQPVLKTAGVGRMLPDIALPTALDTALSRGLAFCFSGSATPDGCTLVRSGGSEAAAAIFGGIAAAIAQQNGPQGNLAPRLYAMRNQTGIFTDVRLGSARLSCAAGSPGCDTSGTLGYDAAPGYDLATGLGVPNAHNLLAAWPDVGTKSPAVTLAVSPTQANATYNPQATVTFTATVTGASGTPTGSINFFDQATGANLNSAPYALDSTGVAAITLTGAMPTGGNSIVAQYSGDPTYAAQNSQAMTVNIQPSSTTTTVTPATTNPRVGTAFTVTATLSVGTPPAGTAAPTGNVTLTLDGANYATSAVTTSGATTSATFSVTVTTSGNHNLQAIYVGDANYSASTSTSVPVNAASNAANVSLAVVPVQSSYNPTTSLTFTATVTAQNGGGTPTGTLNFLDQATGNNLNSSPVSLNGSGVAKVTVQSALPTGGNSVIAQYNGDTNYASANSQAVTVNIQPSSTTTTVTPSTTTPKVNTAFTVTAAVTIGNPTAGTASPTGNMTLTLDGATYATTAVSTTGGATSATFTGVKVTTSGSHNLQAIYAGDTNYSASTSTAVPVNAPTSTVGVTLAVSPTQASATYNPSAAITFTATVASASGGTTPGGTVNFFDQATGNNLNSAPVNLNAAGKASVTVTGGLPQNGNSIVAQYSGDSTYPAANSQVLTVNIQPSGTTSTVTPSTTTPAVGVAFPVTVAIAVGTPAAGTALPTGKVTLTLDGASYATANVTTASGVTSASFKVTVSSSGGHNLQAVYAGDANYAPSTSDTVSVTSSKGATVTALTATPATLTAGTPETFTATISAASAPAGTSNTFTGTMTFFDGASQIGTADVSGTTAALSNVTLSTTTTHSITAVYSGDGSWGGSTSNIVTLKAVLIPVTITLAVTPTTAGPGQVVTLLATVMPNSAPASSIEQNPTGNVIFYNGTTILATVALSPAANNTSTAQLLFTTLPAGQNSLTAVYVGDLYYAAATSNAVTITVQDFTLTPGPDNPLSDLDIDKGDSGQVSYTVTGLGGYNSAIALTCAVPAQDFMTCTPNSAAVTPNGTVTFTVTTYLTGTNGTSARGNRTPLWPPAAGGTALAVLLFFLLPAGRRVRIFTEGGRRMLILFLLLGALGAAGVGCSSVSGSVQGNQGTPLGETTLTITGAANIDNTVTSHSVYLTVNVLPTGSTGTAQPVHGAR